MLPGVKGFNLNDHLNLNPSYFIFPAWRAFAERTHLTAPADIAERRTGAAGADGLGEITSTQRLGGAAGGWQDAASQRVAAADEFRCDPYPAVSLVGRSAQRLARALGRPRMQSYPRLQTPAWINVSTNEVAPSVYGRRPVGGARSDAG